ncbi:hypothetical protein C8R47DRAFT_1072133 [Mycena vitilis]|nr:hypothetical protein C8R47DRAFT_1072133 [Mycena vitilis]
MLPIIAYSGLVVAAVSVVHTHSAAVGLSSPYNPLDAALHNFPEIVLDPGFGDGPLNFVSSSGKGSIFELRLSVQDFVPRATVIFRHNDQLFCVVPPAPQAGPRVVLQGCICTGDSDQQFSYNSTTSLIQWGSDDLGPNLGSNLSSNSGLNLRKVGP